MISFFILYWIFLKLDFLILVNTIKNANFAWFLIALMFFYTSIFLKSIRWKLLLKDAGIDIRLKDASLIFYLSMFVNSIIPAKIGDIYRSYLLKQQTGDPISLSISTVFLERIFDLSTVLPLLLIFAYISFERDIPFEIIITLKYGILIIFALILLTLIFLKINRYFVKNTDFKVVGNILSNFEKGIRTLKIHSIPKLLLLSIISWITEGFTIYAIFFALGLNYGLIFPIFTDLSGSLLTAVPFTPSGLGVVEYALIFILNLKNISITESSAIVVLYRLISYFSIVFFGTIVNFWYEFSLKKYLK
ncbi:flippase-like domain-containing protein [Methanococcus maripaludis]|uniref:flippase-like domain-containing protein n=1 Tax=Methanococcus maripaludis TaxID=39152 RepID=UPI00215D73DB|nr:flippase-like domain-containing protein [Methanococcus maripaludis]